MASGALASVIQSGIADGARRHISIEVGAANRGGLISAFNSTILLMMFSACAVVAVAASATDAVIRCCQVEEARIQTCVTTYYLSIGMIATTVLVTPWQAMLSAKQQLVAVSVLSTLKSVLTALAAGGLYLASGERLVIYASAMLIATLFCDGVMVGYCMWKNPESIPRPASIRWRYLRSITVFGGWIAFETTALAFREKGSLLMLTAFFGPVVTASYDIAQKVGNQLLIVGQTIYSVVSPALTNAEGRGETQQVFRLCNLLSCYACYLVSFILIPFIIETRFALELVFGTQTDDMVLFARVVAITRFIGLISWGDAAVAKAQNRIAVISVCLFSPFVVAFIVNYLLFTSGHLHPAILPYSMFLATSVGSVWFRPWYIRVRNGMGWFVYARDVLVKVLVCVGPAAAVAYASHHLLAGGLARLVLVVFVYFAICAPAVWLFGLSDTERVRFSSIGHGVTNRFRAVVFGP